MLLLSVRSDDADPLAKIQLHLLHQPVLQVGRGAPVELTPKDAALLAILAIDGGCSRSRLAAWLWPATEARQARANLRQRLLRLRRIAGTEVACGEHTLTLAPGVEHDLADPAAKLRPDPHALSGELLGAHDFPDCEELEHWLQQARAHWRARCHATLTEAVQQLEAAGQYDAALTYAWRLQHEEPLHEHHHRTVMRLHLLRHDRSAALSTFDQLRTLLQQELHVQPSAETEQLVQQALRTSDPLTGPVPPPRPRLLMLGEAPEAPLRHAAAARAIHIRAEPQGRHRPYGLIHQLLASLGGAPHRTPAEVPPSDLATLHTAIARLIQQTRPSSLVIEGMEHVDAESIALLSLLAGSGHWWR